MLICLITKDVNFDLSKLLGFSILKGTIFLLYLTDFQPLTLAPITNDFHLNNLVFAKWFFPTLIKILL